MAPMVKPVKTAIRTWLAADATLVAMLASGTPIHVMQAPSNAPMPYIVFFDSASRKFNDTPRDAGDWRYTIKVVAANDGSAAVIADRIIERMHNADLGSVDGWNFYRCQHLNPIEFVENNERQQLYHAGGIFRIRASRAYP